MICDDLAVERRRLTDFLRRFERENALEIDIKGYENADALLQAYPNGCSADILFMDIYMNGLNGMEAAKTLYAKGCRGSFIFCTTSREHAVESYAVDADGIFLSVGQSYLVNLTYLDDWDDEAIRLTDGTRIFMPVREQTRLRRALNEYQWLRLEARE